MNRINRVLLTAILSSTMLAGSAFAQQQGNPAMQQGAQQSAPAISISDEQLNDFADAYVAVQLIGQKYQPKIQSAGDKAKAQALQQQARSDMKQAITDSGIALADYKQIALAANQSETLRNRLSAAIKAIVESQQGEKAQG